MAIPWSHVRWRLVLHVLMAPEGAQLLGVLLILNARGVSCSAGVEG